MEKVTVTLQHTLVFSGAKCGTQRCPYWIATDGEYGGVDEWCGLFNESLDAYVTATDSFTRRCTQCKMAVSVINLYNNKQKGE